MKGTLTFLISLFFLQYLPAQNPPVATNDTFTINKNTQVILPVLSNDYDVDGDSLALSILSPPANGIATLSGNQITYLPSLNYVGTDSFTYVICDSANTCDTATVFITITGNNNYPVAANDSFIVPKNLSTGLPVTSNDYDPDGEALAVSVLVQPSHGSANASSGIVTYTPTQSYSGADTFVYIICDPGNLCDTATVYITVAGINHPPTYSAQEFYFGDTISSHLIDPIPNDEDGDSIYYASVVDLDSTNNIGSLDISSSGVYLVFNRNGIACGTNHFQFILCDPFVCDTGIITIHVTCPENVFLPEGFSPDGDGINDKLVFTRLEYFAPATLQVFNRYGTVVYASEDYKNDWRGTSLDSNNALPDGTYFYILQLSDKRKYNNYLIINR
jgi:gliding motility-associated-like protein